jgi:hypothetical protein
LIFRQPGAVGHKGIKNIIYLLPIKVNVNDQKDLPAVFSKLILI